MSAVDAWLGQQPGSTTPQNAPAVDAWLGVVQQPANVNPPPIPQSGGMPKSGAQIGSKSGVDTANTLPQGWTAPNSFLMGIGDAVRGGATGITKGLSWLANEVAPNSQFAKDASAAIPQMQQTTAAQNAQYDAQRAAQGGSGIDLGRLAGQVVGTAPTMAIGPEYAGLNLAGKIGVGAAQGAAGGAILGGGDPAQTTIGGLLGAAGPLVAAGAGAVGRGLWNAAQPVLQPTEFVGRGLSGAMDQAEAAQAAANIRGAQQFVPGSLPTTAQVAQTPVMVQTEKAAANMPAFKTAMAQRAINNNDARWQALMGVAQTPEALQAAQAAREDATFPLYAAAGDQTSNAGKALVNLFQRPAMRQAAQQADQLAANRGETLVWPQQGGDMSINGRALDYTNRALGDMIGNAKASGNKELASGLADAQSQLQAWTNRYIPAQRQAARTYAQMSVPINTMEVGQQIANGLGTRAMNAGGVPEIQMMPFRSALTSAMNGGNAAKYGIDANALNTLQGIGQDLQRATVSNSIKSPGSDTAYNLAANGWLARNLFGPTFGGSTALGRTMAGAATALAGHPYVGVGVASGLGRIGRQVGERLQDRLTGLLMDPNAILPYLDARAAAPAQAIPGPLMQGLLNYGRPAVVNGLIGGFNKPGNQ